MDTAFVLFTLAFLIIIGFVVYSVIDLQKNKDLSDKEKRHWLLLVGGVPLFGAMIYFFRKPYIRIKAFRKKMAETR